MRDDAETTAVWSPFPEPEITAALARRRDTAVAVQEDDQVDELVIRGELSGERLSSLRRALAEWARRAGVGRELAEAIVLCAYEALANSVEHGYPGRGEGWVALRAAHSPVDITVEVTDRGAWRPPPAETGTRGRGLTIIRTLCPHAEVAGSDRGTTVRMTWTL